MFDVLQDTLADDGTEDGFRRKDHLDDEVPSPGTSDPYWEDGLLVWVHPFEDGDPSEKERKKFYAGSKWKWSWNPDTGLLTTYRHGRGAKLTWEQWEAPEGYDVPPRPGVQEVAPVGDGTTETKVKTDKITMKDGDVVVDDKSVTAKVGEGKKVKLTKDGTVTLSKKHDKEDPDQSDISTPTDVVSVNPDGNFNVETAVKPTGFEDHVVMGGGHNDDGYYVTAGTQGNGQKTTMTMGQNQAGVNSAFDISDDRTGTAGISMSESKGFTMSGGTTKKTTLADGTTQKTSHNGSLNIKDDTVTGSYSYSRGRSGVNANLSVSDDTVAGGVSGNVGPLVMGVSGYVTEDKMGQQELVQNPYSVIESETIQTATDGMGVDGFIGVGAGPVSVTVGAGTSTHNVSGYHNDRLSESQQQQKAKDIETVQELGDHKALKDGDTWYFEDGDEWHHNVALNLGLGSFSDRSEYGDHTATTLQRRGDDVALQDEVQDYSRHDSGGSFLGLGTDKTRYVEELDQAGFTFDLKDESAVGALDDFIEFGLYPGAGDVEAQDPWHQMHLDLFAIRRAGYLRVLTYVEKLRETDPDSSRLAIAELTLQTASDAVREAAEPLNQRFMQGLEVGDSPISGVTVKTTIESNNSSNHTQEHNWFEDDHSYGKGRTRSDIHTVDDDGHEQAVFQRGRYSYGSDRLDENVWVESSTASTGLSFGSHAAYDESDHKDLIAKNGVMPRGTEQYADNLDYAYVDASVNLSQDELDTIAARLRSTKGLWAQMAGNAAHYWETRAGKIEAAWTNPLDPPGLMDHYTGVRGPEVPAMCRNHASVFGAIQSAADFDALSWDMKVRFVATTTWHSAISSSNSFDAIVAISRMGGDENKAELYANMVSDAQGGLNTAGWGADEDVMVEWQQFRDTRLGGEDVGSTHVDVNDVALNDLRKRKPAQLAKALLDPGVFNLCSDHTWVLNVVRAADEKGVLEQVLESSGISPLKLASILVKDKSDEAWAMALMKGTTMYARLKPMLGDDGYLLESSQDRRRAFESGSTEAVKLEELLKRLEGADGVSFPTVMAAAERTGVGRDKLLGQAGWTTATLKAFVDKNRFLELNIRQSLSGTALLKQLDDEAEAQLRAKVWKHIKAESWYTAAKTLCTADDPAGVLRRMNVKGWAVEHILTSGYLGPGLMAIGQDPELDRRRKAYLFKQDVKALKAHLADNDAAQFALTLNEIKGRGQSRSKAMTQAGVTEAALRRLHRYGGIGKSWLEVALSGTKQQDWID